MPDIKVEIWFYTLASVFAVSLVSLAGALTLVLGSVRIQKILVLLVSFAAGTLLGDAFLHLIPEAFKNGTIRVSVLILSGLLFFFILEKLIHWRHCHEEGCDEHGKALPYVVLAGDTLHNLIDGVIIAASYLVSIPVGVATTVAVLLHEIPQEIGDFGTLVYGGMSKAKALLFNFISALAAVAGALAVLIASSYSQYLAEMLVPFAAGGFIYIATADMIPELHKHGSHKVLEVGKQITMFILGIVIMYALLFLE